MAAQWVIAAGAVVTALAVLYRYIVGPLTRLFRKIEHVADTYNGEPARDGLPARPGIVDRLITIESQIKVNGTGMALGDAVALALKEAKATAEAVSSIETKVDRAAELAAEAKDLVSEVKEHAAEVEEAATGQRDEISDRLTNWIEEGQVREAAYLSSLAELGIDIPVQPRKETP